MILYISLNNEELDKIRVVKLIDRTVLSRKKIAVAQKYIHGNFFYIFVPVEQLVKTKSSLRQLSKSECKVTLVSFARLFTDVGFEMYPHIFCLKTYIVTLVAFV